MSAQLRLGEPGNRGDLNLPGHKRSGVPTSFAVDRIVGIEDPELRIVFAAGLNQAGISDPMIGSFVQNRELCRRRPPKQA